LVDRAGRLPDNEELGWSTMRRWLDRNTAPRAVLTAWDSIAYGVLRACREAALQYPMR
jgi:DNA-binding LacI/PurR family transcriptional regulator